VIGGGLVWLAVAAWWRPSPSSREWAALLLLLAPLVLVPASLEIVQGRDGRNRALALAVRWQPLAALLLAIAFVVPAGVAAGLCALPWFAVTALLAFAGLDRLRRRLVAPGELAITGGLVYVAVGGIWTLFSRLGLRPLAFDPSIVLLTGVHFHYAGFMLPVLTGFAAAARPGRLADAAVVGVLAGVPMVAVGITATQLGYGGALEGIAAVATALAAALVGALHLRLATERARAPRARALWTVAAIALLGSMGLAALYGMRGAAVLPSLDVPTMWALHGTANAVGFGFCGLVGWRDAMENRP